MLVDFALLVVLVALYMALPARYDPAIRLKYWLMGEKFPEE